jgi:hypothetical protein
MKGARCVCEFIPSYSRTGGNVSLWIIILVFVIGLPVHTFVGVEVLTYLWMHLSLCTVNVSLFSCECVGIIHHLLCLKAMSNLSFHGNGIRYTYGTHGTYFSRYHSLCTFEGTMIYVPLKVQWFMNLLRYHGLCTVTWKVLWFMYLWMYQYLPMNVSLCIFECSMVYLLMYCGGPAISHYYTVSLVQWVNHLLPV